MIDEKMKAEFARRFLVVDEAEFWAREGVEWVLDYLRSQEEPVGIVYEQEFKTPGAHGKWISWATNPALVPVGTKLYAHPIPSAPSPTEKGN